MGIYIKIFPLLFLRLVLSSTYRKNTYAWAYRVFINQEIIGILNRLLVDVVYTVVQYLLPIFINTIHRLDRRLYQYLFIEKNFDI